MTVAADVSWLDHPARNKKLLPDFMNHLKSIRRAKVLEMGTRRSRENVSTVHRSWAADDAEFIKTDFRDGIDVDVVSDAQDMASVFGENCFDGVISVSVLEHVERPWIAAREIARILKPGGRGYINTCFAFPRHGFPSDYWRFTKEALELIFRDAGMVILGSDYHGPAFIHAASNPGMEKHETFTNVNVSILKPM